MYIYFSNTLRVKGKKNKLLHLLIKNKLLHLLIMTVP